MQQAGEFVRRENRDGAEEWGNGTARIFG